MNLEVEGYLPSLLGLSKATLLPLENSFLFLALWRSSGLGSFPAVGLCQWVGCIL